MVWQYCVYRLDSIIFYQAYRHHQRNSASLARRTFDIQIVTYGVGSLCQARQTQPDFLMGSLLVVQLSFNLLDVHFMKPLLNFFMRHCAQIGKGCVFGLLLDFETAK